MGELEQISWRMRQPAETGSAYLRSPVEGRRTAAELSASPP
jgi:hypothetical protein